MLLDTPITTIRLLSVVFGTEAVGTEVSSGDVMKEVVKTVVVIVAEERYGIVDPAAPRELGDGIVVWVDKTAGAEAAVDTEVNIVDDMVLDTVDDTALDIADDGKVDGNITDGVMLEIPGKVEDCVPDEGGMLIVDVVERKVVLQVATEQLQLEPLKQVFTFEARHTVHDLVHSIPP